MFVWIAAVPSPSSAASHQNHYPVRIQSCNRTVLFTQSPRHAVSNDVNLTEMMVALGLTSRMAGYTGIAGWKTGNDDLMRQLKDVPELARQYPSTEVLVGAGTDFYFAGWDYGMRVGGPLTPETLAPLGVKVYELTESCSHVMPRPAASFNDVYIDLRNLGNIFDVDARAEQLVDGMRDALSTLRQGLPHPSDAVRTFVYDSGEDKPFTAGKLAMPTALIEAAGGRNVMDDIGQSWTRVNWESVVTRNPQAIVIINYGAVTATQKIQFLSSMPALQGVDAVKNRRFIILSYDEATPGIRNVTAVEKIARVLHPDAFKN